MSLEVLLADGMDDLQLQLLGLTALLTASVAIYLLTRARPVYLLGYHVFKAPERCEAAAYSD